MKTGKELVLSAIRLETTERVPWVPFVGCHGGSLIDVGADEYLKDADLIITGEGKIDDQTSHGKTISGVTRLGNEQNIPVIAFAGSVTITDTKNKLGISKYYSISSDDISIEKSIANASTLLKNKVKTVFQKNYTNN